MRRKKYIDIGGVPLRDLRLTYLPYCLHRRTDGSYILLNRDYMPLGQKRNVNQPCYFGSYPFSIRFANMTPHLASRLSHNKSPDMERIYFYDEAHVPSKTVKEMARYIARLVTLARQKVE